MRKSRPRRYACSGPKANSGCQFDAGLTGTSTLGRRTLATGLVASSNNAPVAITLASDYDAVGTGNQTQLRFSLNDLNGRVNPASAVVTVSDGELTVTAVRQSDGTYTANVASLADGALMAKVVLTEGGTSKASSTSLFKSTCFVSFVKNVIYHSEETESFSVNSPRFSTY